MDLGPRVDFHIDDGDEVLILEHADIAGRFFSSISLISTSMVPN